MSDTQPQWLPESQLRFRNEQGQSLSDRDMQLLSAIVETHSIVAAALRLGLSYKTAMRAIQKMNATFDAPLVASLSGGSKGGQTDLTSLGKEWLAALTRRPTLKLSARNQWSGRIVQMLHQGQQTRLQIELAGGALLWARITRLSAEEMGLAIGHEVIAVVKAKNVERVPSPPKETQGNCWHVDWHHHKETGEWRATGEGGFALVSAGPETRSLTQQGHATLARVKTPMTYAFIAEDDVLIGMAWVYPA